MTATSKVKLVIAAIISTMVIGVLSLFIYLNNDDCCGKDVIIIEKEKIEKSIDKVKNKLVKSKISKKQINDICMAKLVASYHDLHNEDKNFLYKVSVSYSDGFVQENVVWCQLDYMEHKFDQLQKTKVDTFFEKYFLIKEKVITVLEEKKAEEFMIEKETTKQIDKIEK